MANVEITNNAPFGIVLWEPVFADELMLATIPAATYAAGTMLKRDAGGALDLYDVADVATIDPVAVLAAEYVADGATAMANRVLIAGRVRKADMLIDNAGTPEAPSAAALDKLKAAGIIAQDVQQLAELDNQ
jgi:hypothetical protein